MFYMTTEVGTWRPRKLGSAIWEPCHGWTDGATTWVDAYYRTSEEMAEQPYLDVGCGTSEDGAAHADQARAEWEAGRVLCVHPYPTLPHVEALIVPHNALSTEVIEEAIARHATALAGSHPHA